VLALRDLRQGVIWTAASAIGFGLGLLLATAAEKSLMSYDLLEIILLALALAAPMAIAAAIGWAQLSRYDAKDPHGGSSS
jgi:hypothetical protein